MHEVWMERSPDARTGARAPTRASKAEEEGGKALKGGTPSWRQRESAGQHALLHTNRGSTARQRAHARARLQCSRKWAPAGVERGQRRSTSTLSKRTLTRWRRS